MEYNTSVLWIRQYWHQVFHLFLCFGVAMKYFLSSKNKINGGLTKLQYTTWFRATVFTSKRWQWWKIILIVSFEAEVFPNRGEMCFVMFLISWCSRVSLNNITIHQTSHWGNEFCFLPFLCTFLVFASFQLQVIWIQTTLFDQNIFTVLVNSLKRLPTKKIILFFGRELEKMW